MSFCYFDVTVGGKPLAERIVMKLYDDITPKTCKNFRALCTGSEGNVPGTETKLSYKGSIFHRVIKSFMIQGGDFTNFNGTGGVSIYSEMFEDENFDKACDRTGLLCMANRGPNTNGSQFFITTTPNSHHLTGKHVVFGEVVSGMNSVRAIENTQTGEGDLPVRRVEIADCGALESFEPSVPADGDATPDYPEDLPEQESKDDDAKIKIAESVRQIGNKAFGAGDFQKAIDKYEKALRYLKTVVTTSANSKDITDKKVACFSNSALCFLKLKQFQEAQIAAGQAVILDNNNTKAIFRRGQASAGLGTWDVAEKDFREVLRLDPGNNDAKNQLQVAVEKQKAAKEKLAKNLRKMFE